jgi:MFS family permease
VTSADALPPPPALGLRVNLPQFSLLVLINAFVGAMAGMERSILPLLAEAELGVTYHSAILSFLIGFGVVKALCNLATGVLSDRFGRKRLLVAGWLLGLPVPFLLMWAPSWEWVVVANLFLGANQGLCWSATVIMKIDLAGPRRRGLAMGLNEFAGYLAVAAAAYASAALASAYGLRPYPFVIGVASVGAGLLLSVFVARETHGHAKLEAAGRSVQRSNLKFFEQIFPHVSWKDRTLFGCCQAGLVNNLNDGLVWGLFPLLFASLGCTLDEIGLLAALYPATWGVAQLATGPASDRFGRKWMIVAGMIVQAFALWLAALSVDIAAEAAAAVLLGLGTAMVYPTLLATVGDAAHPDWRATAVGIYRFWRDLGYAAGAVLAGFAADMAGLHASITLIAFLTLVSGLVAAAAFRSSRPAV